MTTLEALQHQIATAQDLQAVVKTMKALAAASIQQYERAVESLAEYTHTIELGLHVVLDKTAIAPLSAPSHTRHRLGAIVFGSDRGMCGQFNKQIATEAIAQLQPLKLTAAELTLIAVGSRVIAPLEAAGQTIATCLPMPGSIGGITSMVQELLLHIETWRSQQSVDRMLLFYNQPHSKTAYTSTMRQLLPLDRAWLQHLQQQPWVSRTLPMWTMERSKLFADLIRQYLFVAIYRAFAESLASENASRLVAMQVAEQNIETRLAEYNTQFQHQRQTLITDEILEIISGAEVLGDFR